MGLNDVLELAREALGWDVEEIILLTRAIEVEETDECLEIYHLIDVQPKYKRNNWLRAVELLEK